MIPSIAKSKRSHPRASKIYADWDELAVKGDRGEVSTVIIHLARAEITPDPQPGLELENGGIF